jgi:ankyrin repeat protein
MGADYSVVDEYGNSLLIIAAKLPDFPMAKRLLGLGLRGDEPNWFGSTAFSAAIATGSTEIIDALIAAGFNGIDLVDSIGDYSSLVAAEAGNLKMLDKLDGRGAQYSSSNLLGRNTAHAAAGGHPGILKFLNDRGVDLGLADVEGLTALMVAARDGNAAGVSYLLQSQAHSVNQCTLFG